MTAHKKQITDSSNFTKSLHISLEMNKFKSQTY